MNITVQHVIDAMEQWAPLHLAESWDNPGLMIGDRHAIVTGLLTALDTTEELLDTAIEKNCNMVITHHPFLFKGIKSIDLQTATGRIIKKAIQHNIAIYSAHTNLDIAEGGLNDLLAQRLALENIRGFVETSRDKLFKVVCFVPTTHIGAVRQAMGDAGAGFIGNYSHCSFESVGYGHFLPLEGTNPFIGKQGTLAEVEEMRLETIVSQAILGKVLAAMKAVHPYEEVAYEVLAVEEPNRIHTIGRMGDFVAPMNFSEFVEHIRETLPESNLRFAGVKPEIIKTVALCSGGGAEFISAAKRFKADAYITGDMKYHDAQLAKEIGILVVDAGHFGTEECVAEGICQYLYNYGATHGWDGLLIQPFEEQRDFFLAE